MILLLSLLLSLHASLQDTEFERLVRALDQDDSTQRARAAASLESYLLAQGPRALDLLAKVAEPPGLDARSHLQELRAKIRKVEDCRARLAALASLDLPEVRGKRFAVYNTGDFLGSGGDRMEFSYRFGWLLTGVDGKPALLDYSLLVEPLRTDLDLPPNWDAVKKKHPSNRPLPGQTLPLDFEVFCKDVVKAVEAGDAPHASEAVLWTGLPRELTPAILAYWAFEQGLPLLATALEEASLQAWKRLPDNSEVRDLTPVLGERLARLRREQAIERANRGAPVSELLKLWKSIIPLDAGLRGEAKELAALYEQRLKEDATWKRPDAAAFAALPPSAQAPRWVRGLRDLSATQGYPVGPANQLVAFPMSPEILSDQELYRLGWNALPLLIEHLGDRQPTRISYAVQSDRPPLLLRVGDCCRIIFEAVTGQALGNGRTLAEGGDPAEAQKKARAWQEENKKLGEEAFYVGALESEDRQSLAAAHLPRIDFDKHVPRLIELSRKASPERRRTLLSALLPHLGKSQERFLLEVLQSDDVDLRLIAARVLWARCGSDQGARNLLALLREGRMSGPSADSALTFLAEVRTEWAVDAACDLVSNGDSLVRQAAMSAATVLPCRRTAEALVSCLGKKSPAGVSFANQVRDCDLAAEALIDLLQLSADFSPRGSESERDAKISDLRKWWDKNRETIDWSKLAAKVKETLRQRKVELESRSP